MLIQVSRLSSKVKVTNQTLQLYMRKTTFIFGCRRTLRSDVYIVNDQLAASNVDITVTHYYLRCLVFELFATSSGKMTVCPGHHQ